MKLVKTLEERKKHNEVWRKKFAILPVSLSNGSVVWWEWYEQRHKYVKIGGPYFHFLREARPVKEAYPVGTSSGGPCAPTSTERKGVHTGGLG